MYWKIFSVSLLLSSSSSSLEESVWNWIWAYSCVLPSDLLIKAAFQLPQPSMETLTHEPSFNPRALWSPSTVWGCWGELLGLYPTHTIPFETCRQPISSGCFSGKTDLVTSWNRTRLVTFGLTCPKPIVGIKWDDVHKGLTTDTHLKILVTLAEIKAQHSEEHWRQGLIGFQLNLYPWPGPLQSHLLSFSCHSKPCATPSSWFWPYSLPNPAPRPLN